MASTYSPLKIELIGTGEQAGTWGATTNTNLGTALEEAITGSADVAFSSSDVTLTLTNTNAAQVGRNLRLNLTGTSGGARNLILGSGMQIEKLYLINNGLADAVTVKNTTGTGIAVPAGGKTFVYNDGTNVVDAISIIVDLTSQVTGTLPIANGGTGSTSTTFVNLTTNVTGTLPVANGGTGITSLGTGVATFLGTPSSANLAAAVTDETGSGLLVFATSPTLTTPTLTDPAIIGTILEDVYTITDGAAFEIDPGNGSIQLITLGANRTPKATNFVSGEAVTLMVDDGSAYTITWTDATFGGSGVVWLSGAGSAPTLATTGYTAIVLWKVSTQVYGARVG
jgi:hypothetical protein